jgi:hypothetical protein
MAQFPEDRQPRNSDDPQDRQALEDRQSKTLTILAIFAFFA